MPSRNGRSPKINERPPAYSARPRPLTQREFEVVEWIAAGKRNREIGEILGCSSRTVQKHVQHILEKLHLETRTAVCLWSYEQRRDEDRGTPAPRKAPRKK
jgi:DNA-binding CsgD family transcriptional regulator